jgi:hypothetical protein
VSRLSIEKPSVTKKINFNQVISEFTRDPELTLAS